MHKREFFLVILAFFACFGFAVFIGLAGNNIYQILISIDASNWLKCFLGPSITVTVRQSVLQTSVHPNATEMATGPYYLKSPLLTSYNQQLWLLAEIITENKDGMSDYVTSLLLLLF